jgi:hypothetical protein
MLEISNTIDFDIFQLRKTSKDNELVTLSTYLMHKHKYFQSLKIVVDIFVSFMSKIQSGYKDITYHNKTHGADLCQTAYYYLVSCDYL